MLILESGKQWVRLASARLSKSQGALAWSGRAPRLRRGLVPKLLDQAKECPFLAQQGPHGATP